MAKDHCYDHHHHLVEEDYIDMDIASTTYLCYTLPSSPHPMREFEFQMSSPNPNTDHIPSPADELFYKGNLLPLHLPPRLRMVESLLRSSSSSTTTAASTPLQSCNISPAASCYFFKEPHTKIKSWCKKLKLFRQSSSAIISHKLKASKAYLKSLFTKPGCWDATPAVPEPDECSNGHSKSAFMRRIDREKMLEERSRHRWRLSVSSSCSSYGHQMMKRRSSSSSVGLAEECSIREAIAHCKKTHQQQVLGRRTPSDVEFYLLSESPDLVLNVNNIKKNIVRN